MKKFAFILMACSALGISACNTIKGIGEDITSVGEAGQRAM